VREGDLDRDSLRELLPVAWQDTEQPSANVAAWLRLFRKAGYVSDGEEVLSGELTIYRGIGVPEATPGISWSLDIDRARWFARRSELALRVQSGSSREATLYSARVDADQVLAFFNARNEREVVVDPKSLRDVRVLERVEPFPEE
jgi:hypothetical protein